MSKIFNYAILSTILCLLTAPGFAEVIWEQNFENSPSWASSRDNTGSTSATHQSALEYFNTSGYRVSGQSHISVPLLEISSGFGRGNSKGIAYRMQGAGGWRAASADIDFSDPDINWKTASVSRNGYSELWYRVWYRTPEGLDFESQNTCSGGYRLWKAMRAYSFDPEQYCNGCSDPDTFWQTFISRNDKISDHNLSGGSLYKKPFVIPSWYGKTAYWYPQWIRQSDPDGGTSAYFNTHDRRNVDTHLVSGSDVYSIGTNPVPGILGDGNWHLIEYHIKMNDIGRANSLQEIYVDGNAHPISTVGNSIELRSDPNRKFRQIVLFDNFLKCDGSVQSLYMDDMVISTSRLPANYVIGSAIPNSIQIASPNNLRILDQ